MSSSNNKDLNRLQKVSEQTGWNNVTDTSEAVYTVLKFPNKVFFSDMAYFALQIKPPSGKAIGKTYIKLK